MAVTVAIFAALQVAMPLRVRPNLAPPDRTVRPVTSLGAALPSETGAGGTIFTLFRPEHPRPARRLAPVQRSRQRRRAGNQHHPGRLHIGRRHQPEPGRESGRQPTGATNGPVAFLDCLASHGIREATTYQPASRYWRFQWTETAIYLALALAGYCFRRLSRLRGRQPCRESRSLPVRRVRRSGPRAPWGGDGAAGAHP